MEFSMYSNKAQTFLDLAGSILDARAATAQGDRERVHHVLGECGSNPRHALLRRAAPNGFYPVRESLGSATAAETDRLISRSQCFAPTGTIPSESPVAVWTFEEFRRQKRENRQPEWVQQNLQLPGRCADMPLEIGDL